jgi:uncharacterized protein (DUF2236 family)
VTGMDLGYFGPESVTWRVHADPLLWIGGIRALFLQALHPLAMAGLARHSEFRTDPWGRLFRTADYIGVTTYGTRDEADRAAARVRARHAHAVGVEPESGVPYAAANPDLLLWVHCCEIDSFLSTVRRGGLRLRPDEADRYVAEQVRSATLVGIPDAMAPRSVADVSAYFELVRPALKLTEASTEAARFVLLPPMTLPGMLAAPARAGWAAAAVLAFALLPRWARRMYHAPGLPVTDLCGSVAAGCLRTALRTLPPRLREGPNYRRAKARLAVA